MRMFEGFADRLPPWAAAVSPALGVLAVLAAGSAGYLAVTATPPPEARTMWLFARDHELTYAPIIAEWNRQRDPDVRTVLLGTEALRPRMLSGFLGNLPTADLIEVERTLIPAVFAGPIETVGFRDLTERLRAEGLLEAINGPSFSPWTREGRIFGLPHDVHPVMLAYRADLVEGAGIDVSEIETWDDFERVMAPLMADENGDGLPDRRLISFWPNHAFADQIEVYVLQAGGRLFDEHGPSLSSDPVVEVVARLARWSAGPARLAEDVQEWNASGYQQRTQGRVVAGLMPDWLCRTWKNDMPEMAGKVKLMPLPAWEPGGRRTSVWGGTMLGIPKTAEGFDELWAFALHLYTSADLAEELFLESDIVTPVKEHWDSPIYDRPDPYFSGQAKGRMYIELAGEVPMRDSHPLRRAGVEQLINATLDVRNWIEAVGGASREEIREQARRVLKEKDRLLARELERSVFLGGRSAAPDPADGAAPEEGA